jgi:HlyD family secretion protein
MANPKKRKKLIIFSIIGLVVVALTVVAIVRKRDVVITVQTEKVSRRSITEIVVANGKIQPVLQVKISPEVSGEIIELPVKEGQFVHKGDLILKIKPDFYFASRNQAEAGYKSSLASQATAEANLRKATSDYKRGEELFTHKLISDADFDGLKASHDVAMAQLTNAERQVEMSRASLASAEDTLSKTTIVSPLTGTVSKLNSEVGERVVGTATMAGTEVMTISDLNEMEARVDIGEIDVVLIKPGQSVRLEVDAFKDRKFHGIVTEIANSSQNAATAATTGSSTSQEATKFQVKVRIQEKEEFRPGMSVTAEIETRYRTNVLTVPIASVTTRLPKDKDKDKKNEAKRLALKDPPATNSASHKLSSSSSRTNSASTGTNDFAEGAYDFGNDGTNVAKADKKSKEKEKPIEVVFLVEGDRVKMVPVKIGISDDSYWEITEGLQDGEEVVSGGYRAISKDLEDNKRIKKGVIGPEEGKDGEKKSTS